MEALVECVDEELLSRDKDIAMVVLYDHEEVGSSSAYVNNASCFLKVDTYSHSIGSGNIDTSSLNSSPVLEQLDLY